MPALAVAAELRARGADVEFAGGDRAEARMVPDAGYPFHRFAIEGFPRRLSPQLARSLLRAGAAPLACRRIISRARPDVVFGAGGYVSGPMLAAAAAARIPAALLEVDAHMGLANRLAAPLVRRVYLAFPIHREDAKYAVTGRPVDTLTTSSPAIGWQADVLVVGGSLGARHLNEVVAAAWGRADPGFRVMHVTGERELARYEDLGSGWYQVRDFIPDLMAPLHGSGKLVVSRAGGVVFEIAAAGCPSILIPSPNVTADHQTANARHLERAGAAIVIADADLTPELLDATVRSLRADPARMERMAEAARAWSRPDAAARIADDLLTLAR
ncbi:MAG: UDP-N-acetylglucosamine--N-acetylmuramyl-(pentapeptide) pyrophosphoryl-undecaprenol [Gaiellales bacterium]|nr:UDP-N-acetylglucosamine--N-acetylmuramyl-(pentapeptide) pyrophosphoryl-undecaprenol [Gaiellales bacterium]